MERVSPAGDWQDEHLHKACILGSAGSGKTQLLVSRVADALRGEEGAPYGDGAGPSQRQPLKALVLVASPQAVDDIKTRLCPQLGLGDPSLLDSLPLRVETPRAVALEVLSAPQARTFTGRRSRILLPFEENILLEDVKACGVRPKRLREMLKFFYRSWTELADDDPDWLVSDEEVAAHGLLKDCLAFTQGMLECEVSNLAVRWLRESPQARRENGASAVFVDDYQLLSRASQVLAAMLAQDSLTVTGDPTATEEVFERYPHADGLAQMASEASEACVQLAGSHHSAAVAACCASLKREASDSAERPETDCAREESGGVRVSSIASEEPELPDGFAHAAVLATPEDEIGYDARFVAARIGEECAPGDIFVAVPNAVWAHAMQHALENEGVVCTQKPSLKAFNADVRDLSRCRGARLFTLLALVADPHDVLAWRSWCGFGDWLAENPGFAALRRETARRHAAPSEMLENLGAYLPTFGELDAAQQQSLERIHRALANGHKLVRQLHGLQGRDLVESAWGLLATDAPDTPDHLPGDIARLLGIDAGGVDQSAAGLLEHATQAFENPDFDVSGRGAVRIGKLTDAHGRTYETVVLSGFVNGFIPCHAYFDPTKTELDRIPTIHASDVRRVYQAVSKAHTNVLTTSFTQIDAARAERLDLKIDRISLNNATRYARVSPSELIGAMGLEPTKETR